MSTTTQTIDTVVMQRLLTKQPLYKAAEEYGEVGKDRVKFILGFLKTLGHSARVDYTTQLTVFSVMDADASLDAERSTRAERVREGQMLRGLLKSETIEIRSDGSAFRWSGDTTSIIKGSQRAVVYTLIQEVEEFRIGNGIVPVEKILPNAPSQFILHHFDSLREAILYYGANLARTSTCPLLREAWQDPSQRFWFVQKPEYRLRNSLCHFLKCSPRFEHSWVRPEQNVNEKNPVDIKVTSQGSVREALIEVKWMGRSRSDDGTRFTAEYGPKDARDGAQQLSEYLDEHKRMNPSSDTLGYLVVFDCRRARLTVSTTALEAAHKDHYRSIEVVYDPDYHNTRTDFEIPIRIFLEA